MEFKSPFNGIEHFVINNYLTMNDIISAFFLHNFKSKKKEFKFY